MKYTLCKQVTLAFQSLSSLDDDCISNFRVIVLYHSLIDHSSNSENPDQMQRPASALYVCPINDVLSSEQKHFVFSNGRVQMGQMDFFCTISFLIFAK